MRNFSNRVKHLRTSEIRDLMGLASKPNIISFAGGMPNNDLFPINEIDNCFLNLPEDIKKKALQYGPTSGYPPLIETLSKLLEKKGLPLDGNKILVTTGSLQAINILAKIFLDPEDHVITENPCFIGAISVFKSYQAKISSVPIDKDGIIIPQLERILNNLNDKAKLVYITPYFHNPAGINYSRERKKQVYDVIKKSNIPLIEDDAYGEIYFDENTRDVIKPIKSVYNDKEIICYTGSFSKIIAPGIRLGWLLVPDDIYVKAELVKQSLDACSPTLSQVIANEFINAGYLNSYLKKIRASYKERKDITIAALQKHMPDKAEWVEPQGGFYIWINLPEKLDASDILKECVERNTIFIIGKTFDPDNKRNNCLRISYCHTPLNEIEKGVKIISDVIKSKL